MAVPVNQFIHTCQTNSLFSVSKFMQIQVYHFNKHNRVLIAMYQLNHRVVGCYYID